VLFFVTTHKNPVKMASSVAMPTDALGARCQ